jgi:hypothetical protein
MNGQHKDSKMTMTRIEQLSRPTMVDAGVWGLMVDDERIEWRKAQGRVASLITEREDNRMRRGMFPDSSADCTARRNAEEARIAAELDKADVRTRKAVTAGIKREAQRIRATQA